MATQTTNIESNDGLPRLTELLTGAVEKAQEIGDNITYPFIAPVHDAITDQRIRDFMAGMIVCASLVFLTLLLTRFINP